jgi:hypothetical protein
MCNQLAIDLCSEIYALFPMIDPSDYMYILTEKTMNIISIIFYFKEVIETQYNAEIVNPVYADSAYGVAGINNVDNDESYETYDEGDDETDDEGDTQYGGTKRKNIQGHNPNKKPYTDKNVTIPMIDADIFLGDDTSTITYKVKFLVESKYPIFNLLDNIYKMFDDHNIVRYINNEPFKPTHIQKKYMSDKLNEILSDIFHQREESDSYTDNGYTTAEDIFTQDSQPPSPDPRIKVTAKRRPIIASPEVSTGLLYSSKKNTGRKLNSNYNSDLYPNKPPKNQTNAWQHMQV